MEHINESDLVQWHSLPAARQEELRTHLAQCPPCLEKWNSQMRLWSVMEAWQPPTPGNLEAAILRRISAERARPRYWRPLIGVAAAVAVSSTVGYLAGLGVRQASDTPLSAEQAAMTLYLDELSASATGDLPNLFSNAWDSESSQEVPG